MSKIAMRVIFLVVLAALVAFMVMDFSDDDVSGRNASPVSSTLGGKSEPAATAQGGAAAQLMGHFAFRKRPLFGKPQGTLFDSHSWQSLPAVPTPVSASPPVPPPMPYMFSGASVYNEQLQVFLAKGDSVIPISLGETIDGGYRIDAIDERQITLKYLPLEQDQVIPISTSLSFAGARVPTAGNNAASPANTAPGHPVTDGRLLVLDERNQNKPARILWQGPKQVKLGTPFEVTLRVTSAQPVGASPMQIKVNSALFETVSVKPGRFFEDREQSFNYRIDPGGTIFVGSSSPKPAPAADAEFVVLTFKPLKPAPTAELALASLSLHGAAGRVIPFDFPANFVTAITN
jgi:hypothetical protein